MRDNIDPTQEDVIPQNDFISVMCYRCALESYSEITPGYNGPASIECERCHRITNLNIESVDNESSDDINICMRIEYLYNENESKNRLDEQREYNTRLVMLSRELNNDEELVDGDDPRLIAYQLPEL